MIVLKSWLQDYINIPWSDEELVQKLTDAGSLVDSCYPTLDQNVVVTEILEIKPHPNADKLRMVLVNDGKEQKWVVCGAPNIEVGQKVPLAKIGAKIGDIVITEALIRGEKSNGMLCSELELGLGNNHLGILILPAESHVGDPLSIIYESDLVLDLEITPNRGDCLSHFGIAREIASILGRSLSKEPISLTMSSSNVGKSLSIKVLDTDLCPKYFARVIKDVKIGPSPEWLVKRLRLCGIKSINNVVDVTNYIMLDLGQPLHAFDASKVNNGQIVVRKSRKNEDIVTLDGQIKNLETGTLLICDPEKPLAIAGVMGGESTGITNSTTDVVLEAAEFDRVSIRKTAKYLNLTTDASYRFERGIDSANIEYALNKAAKLIKDLAGGSIMQGIAKHDSEISPICVSYDFDKINKLLGTTLKREEIDKILKQRGFKIEEKCAIVPTWRHDVTIWQDLAEEIMCIYGMNNIKAVPVPKSSSPQKTAYYFKEHLKDILVDLGFSEIYSYAFMSDLDIKTANLNAKDLLVVENPVSPENKYMRNSLVPGMLTAIAKNPTYDPVLLFEIGNVFGKNSETTRLCIATAGNGAEKVADVALNSLGKLIKLSVEESKKRSLTREELKIYKIKKPVVYYVEIDLTDIQNKVKLDEKKLKLKPYNKDIIYRPISKYPSVTRDLAFIVDKKISAEDIAKTIYDVSDMVINVDLFDEFSSDRFGIGKKNVAYHLNLQAQNKTLQDKEAQILVDNIVTDIKKKFDAKLRDK
ncbi:MAG: Phenylalanine--tRNA ligase beta subunit [bacterium ADurb.Bin212]|nr:MAG: Phenylalanine--tRNA ligase beta subunit [bacterium ADurb.Bin212]